MFQDYLKPNAGRRVLRKGGLIFLSLTVHTLSLLLVVVVPLVRAESSLPGLTIAQVTLMGAPPPPGIPVKGSPKGAKPAGEQKNKPKASPQKPQEKVFAVPIKVPDSIPQEDFLRNAGIVIEGIENGVDISDLDIPASMLTAFTSQELPDQNHVLRIPKVLQPKLIRRIEPAYPPLALQARIEGTVIVDAVTDTYGRVREVNLISGHPLLNEAALTAVRQWVYEPYLVNGMPNQVRFVVTLTFRLSRN